MDTENTPINVLALSKAEVERYVRQGEKYKEIIAAMEKNAPLEEVSQLYVKNVYARMSNNKVHTADALGIDRRTLQRWEKKWRKGTALGDFEPNGQAPATP